MSMRRMASKKALLPAYKATLLDELSRKRYEEKLLLLGEVDPLEMWKNDVDLWPSTTSIHVGIYLVFSPSPYTSQD